MEHPTLPPDGQNTQATPEQIAKWIDRHSARAPLPPCRVDEMTEREVEIFNVVAYHLGFINFLRSTLPPDFSYYPRGRFPEVVESILKDREGKPGAIEFGPAINFLHNDVEAPKASLFTTDNKD